MKTNHIYQGDCLEVMKTFPDKSIDLVLTDPPYGVDMDKGFKGSRAFGGTGKPIFNREYTGESWDNKRPSKKYFDELIRIGKKVIIFGGNFFADLLPLGTHWLVWDKLNTMPTFGDCELLWTNIDRKSVKKYTYEYNGLIGKEEWRAHPTQKPRGLLLKIITDYSDPHEIILDPFMGSGTTLEACKMLYRNFIGIDISPDYCKIAEERLSQEVFDFPL